MNEQQPTIRSKARPPLEDVIKSRHGTVATYCVTKHRRVLPRKLQICTRSHAATCRSCPCSSSTSCSQRISVSHECPSSALKGLAWLIPKELDATDKRWDIGYPDKLSYRYTYRALSGTAMQFLYTNCHLVLWIYEFCKYLPAGIV